MLKALYVYRKIKPISTTASEPNIENIQIPAINM